MHPKINSVPLNVRSPNTGIEIEKTSKIKNKTIESKVHSKPIKNIRFFEGDAGDFLVEYARNKKADVVIMDPPRSGSDEAFLKSLIKIKPRSIVYISCNPDTQIRDVKILEKGGYKAEKCMPFDLFPYTEHIENICVLKRGK